MASKKASLEHLRKVSLFSSCSTKDLEKIHKAGDEVPVKAGYILVDQGQTGREAFVMRRLHGESIDIDQNVWQSLGTPNGSETIGEF